MALEYLVFFLLATLFVSLIVLLTILDYWTQIRRQQQEEMQQELRDLYEAQRLHYRTRPNGLQTMNYIRAIRTQNPLRRRQNQTGYADSE